MPLYNSLMNVRIMKINSGQVFQNEDQERPDNTLLSKLKPLLKSNIQYIGLINKQGRFVDAICKKQLDILPGQLEMFFMGIRLQCSMQEDFDGHLGTLSYILIHRTNVKIISIPLHSLIVVVITDKKSNHSKIIEKIMNVAHDLIKQDEIHSNVSANKIDPLIV